MFRNHHLCDQWMLFEVHFSLDKLRLRLQLVAAGMSPSVREAAIVLQPSQESNIYEFYNNWNWTGALTQTMHNKKKGMIMHPTTSRIQCYSSRWENLRNWHRSLAVLNHTLIILMNAWIRMLLFSLCSRMLFADNFFFRCLKTTLHGHFLFQKGSSLVKIWVE